MADLSYSQAIEAMNSLLQRPGQPPTVDELRAIFARTRVADVDPNDSTFSTDKLGPTKAAMLFSGGIDRPIGGFPPRPTSLLVQSLSTLDPTIASPLNTHFAKLLAESSPFYAELVNAFKRLDPSISTGQIDDVINSPTGGFWSTASERFAAAHADKPIVAFAVNPPNVDPGRVFSANEIRQLVQGTGTGSVNGIPLGELRSRFNELVPKLGVDAAVKDITEVVAVKSYADAWSDISIDSSGGAFKVQFGSRFFESVGLRSPTLETIGFSPSAARPIHAEISSGLWDGANVKAIFQKAGYLRSLAMAGKLIGKAAGPAGDLIELAVLSGSVVGLLRTGDRAGAARLAVTGLSSILGGAGAAGLTATYALPLLAGGPPGFVAYTLLVGAAAVGGSLAGEGAADRGFTFFANTLPRLSADGSVDPGAWLEDGFGRAHSFVTRTLPNGMEYAARVTRETLSDAIHIVKLFGPSTPLAGEPEIVVTADRSTGAFSVSGLPASLAANPSIARDFGQAILDFARGGGSLSGGSGGGNAYNASGLAAVRTASVPTGGRQPAVPVFRDNGDGTVTIGTAKDATTLRAIGTDNRGGYRFQDSSGSLVDIKVEMINGVAIPRIIGTRNYSGKLEVVSTFKDGKRTETKLQVEGKGDSQILFSDAGDIIGSQLGYRLAGSSRITGALSSATLRTVGHNLGEILDAAVFGVPGNFGSNAKAAIADIDGELLANFRTAGIGALSSFLTAQLVSALGVGGFAAELTSTAAGAAIGQVVTNLADIAQGLRTLTVQLPDGSTINRVPDVFSKVGPTMVLTAVGSFLGTQLASRIVKFDTVGGQIGSSAGAAIGAFAAGKLISIGGALGGPIGAAIGAFVGFIAGGLIGSIFGGTPRSGADATWDLGRNQFAVSNVWARKGGSRDAARGLATAAAETFNAVLSATGGTLLNPLAVTAGNYGMRKSDYVYQPVSSSGQNAITFRLDSKVDNAFGRLVGFGVVQGLRSPGFEIAGGDVLVKRALYNTFDLGSIDATNFDTRVVLGNIASAQAYGSYLANAAVINALVAAEPDSVFATETLINLARADELGLTRRHRSDWFGGFGFLLKEAGTTAATVSFGFDYDPASRQISRLIGLGDYVMGDAIDIAGQTSIEATAASETIDLRGGRLADQRGYRVNGVLASDIAATGSDFTGLATTIGFAAGVRRTSVSVAITNDGLSEATERFLARLTDAPDMRIIGGDAIATILDGVSALPTLVVGDSYAFESDGHAVFRLSLSRVATQAITVALTLTGDRATGGGVDFGAAEASNLQISADGINWINAATATFAIGQTELFVRTAVIADNAPNPAFISGTGQPETLNIEGNERFRLAASVTSGAAALANGTATVSGTGTIVDGSGTEPLVWIDDVIVDEASGTATFVISRSRTLATSTTVGFATSDRRVLDITVAATVDAGAGDDAVHASDLGDNIFGGSGNDTLFGGRLDDWLIGGDGNDVLDAGGQTPGSLGGDGNYLAGGAGNDTLRGREGSDWLDGGEGADTLDGGSGDDILAGGTGDNDQLRGGAGSDQYIVRRGDGLDILEEDAAGAPVAGAGAGDAITQRMAAIALWRTNPNAVGALRPNWAGTAAGVGDGTIAGGDDAIVFGGGIAMGDIRLQRSGTLAAPGNDLIIQVMQTINGAETFSGTQVTVRDWFTNPFKRIEWLRFADGTEVRIGDIASFIVGGSGNDVLIGTSGNDFVYGGDGNDRMYLLAGDDVGNGGTGDDMVAGDAGRDLLIGGLGGDELIGGAGNDALSGDAGADDLYGGAGDDRMSGGRGDGDLVVGGAGNDTFKFSRGDGRDTYIDEFVNNWTVVWTATGGFNAAAGFIHDPGSGQVTGPGGVVLRRNIGTADAPDYQWVGRYDYDSVTGTLRLFTPPAGAATIAANSGTDTIEFAPDINLQDVILRRSGNDLVFAVSRDDEELANTASAKDSITVRDWYAVPGQIERLAFYQTGVLDIAPASRTLVAGTDGADGTLNTPLQGTGGADWITGAAGDDVIAAGSGNDIIAGNSGSDVLRGELGDDVLYGGTGNDVLDGGAGRDVLIGGAGQDTASYASASAMVRAHLSAAWANSGDATGDEYTGIEDLTGGSGADILGGDAGQNEIRGGAGNDVLEGNGGDDTYIWNVGDGADTILDRSFVVEQAVTAAGVLATGYTTNWTNTGTVSAAVSTFWRLQVRNAANELVYDNATYSHPTGSNPAVPVPSAYVQAGWLAGFARTNGQQVTRQRYDANLNAGSDELEFGPNISLGDLSFIRSGNNLIVRHGGLATSQVTIRDHFLAHSAIETLKFADGFSVSLASILVATTATQVAGTVADDILAGRAGTLDDNLSGGDGNDTLIGYAGNDQLSGGAGDDTFEGGLGADLIDGGANSASAAGPNAGDTVRYVRSAAAVTIDLNLATAQGGAAGADSVGDILRQIENVVGSSFADTLTGDAADNRLSGLDGNDTILGGGGNDVLIGDGGNDTLSGSAGEDNLSGGDGDDTLQGGSERDILDGGDGTDTLSGDAGNDMLSGGAGNDTLIGGDGDDVLAGGDGNDTLQGGADADTLSGGLGNDALDGGAGNDRFALDRFSGSDTIVDTEGSNAIVFDQSVSHDQVWLTRVGNDLRVAVIGGDTVVQVTGYFLASGQTRIRTIETATHTIFLDHPEVASLVTAMTAATATPAVTPAAMPAVIVPTLSTYWHAGGKAAPRAPAAPRTIALAEDGSLAIDGSYGVIDHDQNVTGYRLKAGAGPTKGAITGFNPSTGALSYTPFADANGVDSFVVIATDADGNAVELPVSVTIAAINDAPRNLVVAGAGALSVQESAPGSMTSNGTVVGQFAATDVEGDTITWSLIDDAGGRFAITPTGELRVLNATLLDREAATSHTIRVVATDANGSASPAMTFTVTVANVNEAPAAPALGTSRGITPEFVPGVNAANLGATVAQFALSDPDGGTPSLAFAPGGNPGGLFSIAGNEVRFAIEPDFEALAAAGFTLLDSDGDGLREVTLTGSVIASDGSLVSATSTSFSLRIEDVNQAPTAMSFSTTVSSVAERDRLATGEARPEIVLGTGLSVSDPDLATELTGQHGFVVFEGASTTASTRFAVNAANQLVLLANQSLDFETDGASITLRIRATDRSSTPLSFQRSFSFAISDRDDVLEGSAAADSLTGQQNRDVLRGLGGNDLLSGLAGDDLLEGGDGDDTLHGGDGADVLVGGTGNDRVNGDAGNDILWGGDGNDVLSGGAGNDTLNGEAGSEGERAAGSSAWRGFTAVGLSGGDGDDVLNGGDGDDFLDGGAGADQLNGGAGFDGVTYATSGAAVNVNLLANSASGGTAQGDTFSGIELVEGSEFGDTIRGSAAGNVIYGMGGNDIIYGGAGNDALFGGAGDDFIDAESGNDYLDGGAGNDTLLGGTDNDTYFIGRNQGHDWIRNYDAEGTNFDHIAFDGSILYTDIWFDRVDDAGSVSASGSHLRMSILGTSGVEGMVTVENWFLTPGRQLPENYFKIDLISDGDVRAALPVNVDALVALMATVSPGSRPTTQSQMAALRSGNPVFANSLEDHWGRLSAPRISDTVSIAGIEPLDNATQTVSFAVRAWFQDDQGLGVTIPASSIDLELTTTGGHVLSSYVTAVDYGTPDTSGNRTVTLTLAPNASTHLLPGGTLPLQLLARIRGTNRTALDAGGIALTVAPTADTPWLTQLATVHGNAGGLIPIYVGAGSPDTDGSERVDIMVSGLPSGYVLTNQFGQAVGVQEGTSWRISAAQAATLHMFTPAGSFQDAALTVTARSADGSSTRNGPATPLTIRVNGAPTSIAMRGLGLNPTPRIAEFVQGVTTTHGVHVGVVVPTDPDSVEQNLIPNDLGALPRFGAGEDRIVSAVGPAGTMVQVMETANNLAAGENGGGVPWVSAGMADTSKAYRFTIFVKPGNNQNHWLYFGTSGNVQNASTGTANTNPYFWHAPSNSLLQDRWYRVEGYVLPAGHVLVGDEVYGGVFDTVTGAKVANTFTFRFGSGASETGARFFSYYGSTAGYSAQWFQPIVERLDNSYALDNNAGNRFTINPLTGLVTANGSAFDRESAAAHNIVVRVTDGGGLSRSQTVAIGVDNVNERPNTPNGGATIWAHFDESGLGSRPAAPGLVVATVPVSDPDGTTPSLVFSRIEGFGGFEIVGNQIRFSAAAAGLDFESFRANGQPVHDWNGDGRLEAHIANLWLRASDGSLSSADEGLVQVFITDVNERPNGLVLEAQNLFSETVAGDTSHATQLIARFGLSDPDGPTPALVILNGNDNRWFQVAGGHIAFAPNVNFTADWLRANRGQFGTDSSFSSDVDGDGLLEIRVATLTLAARDASGAESVSFQYVVRIEDKNETPWFSGGLTHNLSENPAAFQHVGTITGGDVDGPGSELRYVFHGWDWFFHPYFGTHVSRSPDQRFLLHWDGRIFVNGSQPLDFDAPGAQRQFAYGVHLYDKAFGQQHQLSNATVTINLHNVNEAHTLINASRVLEEGSYAPHVVTGGNSYDSTEHGPTARSHYDLRSIMLSDPEGGTGIRFSFADGSLTNGIWSIDGDTGKLYLTNPNVDYEALTTRWDTYWDWDPYTQEPIERWVAVRDLSLATQSLAIRAWDGVHSTTGTFTVRIGDRNEGPTLGWAPQFIVRDDQANGFLGRLWATDPETGAPAVSYSVVLKASEEQFRTPGGSSDIDNTGNPIVWVNWNDGRLFFNNPGDGEWEGGIRNHPTLGGRWSYQLRYTMTVTMTDASGVSNSEDFTITFLKHNTSFVLPIMLDLDGDGIELVDSETSTVRFDMDKDGIADRTGWTAADDGMLVLDRNGNGTIDDASEISFAADDEAAVTDLEGLRAWDTNRNGFLDAGDADFESFQVWRDINQNGVSEANELFRLRDLDITRINLTLNLTGDEIVPYRNVIFATSQFYRGDGTVGIVGDVSLAFDPSKPPEEGTAPPIVFDLDGDDAPLVAMSANKVRFDMNGDGIADRTGWIEPGDGFLVLDRNGNGIVDGIDEISFVKDKQGAKTDLEGLAAFDSNMDGVLDGEDARFVEFRVWVDGNSNGTTDAGELLSLAEAGIVSINLAGVPTGETETEGSNIVYNTGTYTMAGGNSGRFLDAGLAYKALKALPTIEFQKSDWEDNAKRYRIGSTGAALQISPRRAAGPVSADAGQVGPASIMSFEDRTVGLLSTILIDLDGDGLEARRASKTAAAFDMDGDGIADDTGWVSGGDGMLVIDRDGDGAITHASELSFLSEKENATSAWDGLSVLDNTRDGKLDKSDARFGDLRIWVDRNGDGVSQADELKSLGDMGISEIGLRTTTVSQAVRPGDNAPQSLATYKRANGTTATIGTVALGFVPSSVRPIIVPEQRVPVTPTTPDDLYVTGAAARLAQAMNASGAGVGASSHFGLDSNKILANEWLTAA